MRKTFIMFALCCSLATSNIAATPEQHNGEMIALVAVCNAGKPGSASGYTPFPRTPILAPTVYLDNHTLWFDTVFEEDIEVQLLDPDTMEDDVPTVVYSTTLTAGDDEITLPSTYTGEYGIRLVVGNWYFIGIIDL